MFKASDYRISPFAVESVLLESPAVAEAAVVPSPDPIRLAVPKAYVVLADGYHPNKVAARLIFEHSRDRLAPYQRIRRLEFGPLPKTISGKIRRVELRGLEQTAARARRRRSARTAASSTASRTSPSCADFRATFESMSYVDVAGLRTWHEIDGTGEPVVLLHGAFGGASSWFGSARTWSPPVSGSISPSAAATCTPPMSPGR